MKKLSFVLLLFFLIAVNNVLCLEIQSLDENGFCIGKPMSYVISSSMNKDLIGQEGTFVFGKSRNMIDGQEYYDCTFGYVDGTAHFFFKLDADKKILLEKGLIFGKTEITISPAVTVLSCPLQPEKTWAEKTSLLGKNIEIPNMPILTSLAIEEAIVENRVIDSPISVPAGRFDALLVESNFAGNILGLVPIALTQRIWVDKNNVLLKLDFELQALGDTFPLFGMELVALPPCDVSFKKLATTWGKVKTR